jgi:hypothetical protein
MLIMSVLELDGIRLVTSVAPIQYGFQNRPERFCNRSKHGQFFVPLDSAGRQCHFSCVSVLPILKQPEGANTTPHLFIDKSRYNPRSVDTTCARRTCDSGTGNRLTTGVQSQRAEYDKKRSWTPIATSDSLQIRFLFIIDKAPYKYSVS